MNIKSIAKYIDQPLVINKIQKAFPAVLIPGVAACDAYLTIKTPKEERKNNFIRNTIILASTVGVSLLGARGLKLGGKQIIKGLMPIEKTENLINKQKSAIQEYLKNESKVPAEIKNILLSAQERELSVKEIGTLLKKTKPSLSRNNLFNTLFSEEEELTSKGIFQNMKRLPLYGAYAISSGLISGLIADKITHNDSQKNAANKVKEAVYQYFANTFLCIVGAGVSLMGLERLAQKGIVKNITPAKKMAAVIGGIAGVGVIFGSAAANLIGKKIINPLFKQVESEDTKNRIYSERRPEILDICIHLDDLATAGVYSGFRWLESVLPVFYILAGYRAGIGHRNVKSSAAVSDNKSPEPDTNKNNIEAQSQSKKYNPYSKFSFQAQI